MIESLLSIIHHLISFIILISVIVFVHEFGHYFVARCCGVLATDFSIGFGKKLCSYKDSRGTVWKICAIPMGGYVKFLGDMGPTSTTVDTSGIDPKQQQYMFNNKSILQKAAIVAAGPGANFVFSIIVLAGFLYYYGTFTTSTVISNVIANSAAEKAGIVTGDKIITINDKEIENFFQVEKIVTISPNIPLEFVLHRKDSDIRLIVIPQATIVKTDYDREVTIGRIGVQSSGVKHIDLSILGAVKYAIQETIMICDMTLKAIGQMFTGDRSYKEVEGPLGIAKLAGESAKKGATHLLWLMALLSINLGLINLLPIPVLDGGHLAFYVIETIMGKKIAFSIHRVATTIGLVIVIALSLLAIVNDIVNIKLF